MLQATMLDQLDPNQTLVKERHFRHTKDFSFVTRGPIGISILQNIIPDIHVKWVQFLLRYYVT